MTSIRISVTPVLAWCDRCISSLTFTWYPLSFFSQQIILALNISYQGHGQHKQFDSLSFKEHTYMLTAWHFMSLLMKEHTCWQTQFFMQTPYKWLWKQDLYTGQPSTVAIVKQKLQILKGGKTRDLMRYINNWTPTGSKWPTGDVVNRWQICQYRILVCELMALFVTAQP